MMKKIFIGSIYSVVCAWFYATQAIAQTVEVKNSPRSFTVDSPIFWVRNPTTNKHTRIRFGAPSGTPSAECAIIVQQYPELRGEQQYTLNQKMAAPTDPAEVASQLSSRFANVTVLATGVASVSGFPAQLDNSQFSTVAPSGELLWARQIRVTTATTPGLMWTMQCAALGNSIDEAQKGFLYWKSEIMRFLTNIKIQ